MVIVNPGCPQTLVQNKLAVALATRIQTCAAWSHRTRDGILAKLWNFVVS